MTFYLLRKKLILRTKEITMNPFDGKYTLAQTIIVRPGDIDTQSVRMVIATKSEQNQYVLDSGSQFNMSGYTFQLSGVINADTGVAQITGQQSQPGATLKDGLCIFEKKGIVSGSFLFDGAAAIGFYFFIGGFNTEAYEGATLLERQKKYKDL
jgi:hypothetical protein